MVIPIGCRAYPCSSSYRLTVSITQYCQAVESPHSGMPVCPSISAKAGSTSPPPEDSLATSQRRFGRS